jgi:hypothetical protein
MSRSLSSGAVPPAYAGARCHFRFHDLVASSAAQIPDPITRLEILDDLMAGRTQDEISADPEMPSATTVRQWMRDNVDGFAARYHEARQIGYQTIADQTLRIVDDRSNWIYSQPEDGTTVRTLDPQRVSRALARVSTRRWLLSKMMPKTFGDRRDVQAQAESGGATAAGWPRCTT